jgi:hypothetical protein
MPPRCAYGTKEQQQSGKGIGMKKTIFCVLAISCGMAITAAGAAARAEGDAAAAKAAFARGSKLFDKGDFPAAADAFREANRFNPSWKLYYNIGQAEAAAKRYGLALEAFEQYLAEGGDEVAPDRNNEVMKEIKRLRELVGSVEIKAPEGAAIFVDDFEHGKAPLPGAIKLSAGIDHSIRAEKDGAVLESRTIRVSGGDTTVVELGLPKPEEGPAPVPAAGAGQDAPSPASAATDASPLKLWGWVTLGVGAAVAIGGGVVGGMALSLDKQLKKDCTNNECPPAQHDDIAKRDKLGVASTALIAAGAAVAATGAVLLIVGYKKDETSDAPGTAEVSFVPAAGPGFAGAALMGRF